MEYSPRLVVDDEIILIRSKESDADEVFNLIEANRSFLRTWLTWVDETTEPAVAAKYLKSVEIGPPNYRILYRGELCGCAGFNTVSELHQFATIGYWLGDSFNGMGIMTRVCKALTKHCFKDLKLNKVEISAAADNKPSRAIPERLGFKEESTLRQREFLTDGKFHDFVTYGMLKSEFK